MKIHTFRLKPGADLKTEIENFVKTNNIKAGFIVTCVGGLSQACMRMAGAESIQGLSLLLPNVSTEQKA